MWKGVGNKGRWLGQTYKGNARNYIRIIFVKKTDLKSANQVYKKEQTLVQV